MTDWNARYQKGETPWEKGAPAPPLLELLEKADPAIWGGGPVLVPGCGTGHDVRALAATGLPALGLDLAEEAIDRAHTHPKIGGESYEIGDFLDPQWRQGKTFPAIWEHTCLCAIDPSRRADYAHACAELIAPGGCLTGVFFLTPYDPGEAWVGPPFPADVDELDAHFSPWFEREIAWVPEAAYPGREGREWLAVYRRK
ncbi:MAG: methyltransferase domain-containing protein [Luteolibacter sp.]